MFLLKFYQIKIIILDVKYVNIKYIKIFVKNVINILKVLRYIN